MQIEVNEILAKKILTEAQGYLDVGFTHSLNPYSGCAFSCKYCYVREMPIQRFKEVPWGEWLDIKVNAADNYRKEIQKLHKQNKSAHIFMSSATDPYQPIERKAEITRAILSEMLDHPPDMLQIQTRSPLITRDLDLLTQLKNKCRLLVSITVETDREDVKRVFAPYAPGIQLRINALREIHEQGITTQASISPVLPFTPEFAQALKGAADRIWIDTLNIGDGALGRRSQKLGMPQLFAEQGLQDWYREDIHVRVAKYFKKYFPDEMVRVSKAEAFLTS